MRFVSPDEVPPFLRDPLPLPSFSHRRRQEHEKDRHPQRGVGGREREQRPTGRNNAA